MIGTWVAEADGSSDLPVLRSLIQPSNSRCRSQEKQIMEPLKVMSSQLGRMILNASVSTEDEMSARPDPDGSYGPLDEIFDEVAAQRLNESRVLRRSTAGTQVAI